MNEIISLTNSSIIIFGIIIFIIIIVLAIKIYLYVKFFDIAKNIEEINSNQEAIIKLLIEIKNKKDYNHEND